MKRELSNEEIYRLEEHVEFLVDNLMTWENRETYYEENGYVLSMLEPTSFDTSELYHTFTKEVEFGRGVETEEKFNEPFIQCCLPVIKSEMIKVRTYISQQKRLEESEDE